MDIILHQKDLSKEYVNVSFQDLHCYCFRTYFTREVINKADNILFMGDNFVKKLKSKRQNIEKLEDPNLKTIVVHSETKNAWNIVGQILGDKYKIARIPYVIDYSEVEANKIAKEEALIHAKFISECFNNSNIICELLNK